METSGNGTYSVSVEERGLVSHTYVNRSEVEGMANQNWW